jgi:ribonuclease HII
MEHLHLAYPEYGFERHKGYPTVEHRAVLAAIGPCPVHRRSFAPVRAAVRVGSAS